MTDAEKDALIEALLAERGRQAISKAEGLMPGLMEYRRRYDLFQPLHGARIAGCSYFDAKTAVLIETLIALGAEVQWTNPGYTYNKEGQNAVASALKQADVLVNLWNDQTDWEEEEAKRTVQFPNGTMANMVVDENGLLISCPSVASSAKLIATSTAAAECWKNEVKTPNNPCELVAMAKLSSYDVCEYSLVQYIKEVTDKLPAPENVCVVIGYNARGKSCARALRSIGVQVLISVPHPIPAVYAKNDGFKMLSLQQACKRAKVFVIAMSRLEPYVDFIGKMKDNSMICNISAIDYNVDWLKKNAEEVESSEIYLARYKLENGNHVELLNLHRLDRVLERYTNAVSYTYTLWLLTLIHISKKLNSEEPISLPDDLEEQAALLM